MFLIFPIPLPSGRRRQRAHVQLVNAAMYGARMDAHRRGLAVLRGQYAPGEPTLEQRVLHVLASYGDRDFKRDHVVMGLTGQLWNEGVQVGAYQVRPVVERVMAAAGYVEVAHPRLLLDEKPIELAYPRFLVRWHPFLRIFGYEPTRWRRSEVTRLRAVQTDLRAAL